MPSALEIWTGRIYFMIMMIGVLFNLIQFNCIGTGSDCGELRVNHTRFKAKVVSC